MRARAGGPVWRVIATKRDPSGVHTRSTMCSGLADGRIQAPELAAGARPSCRHWKADEQRDLAVIQEACVKEGRTGIHRSERHHIRPTPPHADVDGGPGLRNMECLFVVEGVRVL